MGRFRQAAPRMEFHISRRARELYQFDDYLFAFNGNVIFANFHAARTFAQKMNTRRDLVRFPEQTVRAGQINALGLIDEILHLVMELYRRQVNPRIMQEALLWLETRLGREALDRALEQFCTEFPPLAVHRGEMDVATYLAGETDGMSHRQVALEEMLMLWVANMNPACGPYLELFDDETLERTTVYQQIVTGLHEFFETQPYFGPDNLNLVDMLRDPAVKVPHSLTGQLEYIRQRWFALLGKYLYRLLSSLDFIKEEEKAIFAGPGPSRVYDFRGLQLDEERFSPDREWMPRLVLIAKNTYVWLDQLSKQYQRPIQRLDQVPDEELDVLARRGFTGLWLIGLWERSEASKRIKQMMGNPDAVASAYSLRDYRIADDLGGEDAYNHLKARAWQRGIRMASDMVPNHMGIDSTWVIEHPDWFISLEYPPFPSYTFNGPDLSPDGRVSIYLEDHYYTRTDAAVVFKLVDHRNGRTYYIYHGNDGTSMPWNDTAQLNYLRPDVREAVIQTILAVARRSPIIRFDAAMTLAKKHYQRLWFPEPGTGGDIPSRAEFGMTKEQFDAAMPQEFWREVVERVAAEAPDTLLLAEAFWLMEGYFVRTLGMHRVYNSAFMNMLRDEKNAEYRLLIKNTLEFDPQILKRYVNFMNNPDERTAVDQFGKGDKYFGICTLMSTLPGLPMFGHGQVEGYAEKYGMEFRRAYWDEKPDPWLVERHEREISPLLHRRYLFADVENFYLYDFYAPEGYVNEDVFAYSNRVGDERALVVYHNKFATARGWIRTSVAYKDKRDGQLKQKSLGEGLGFSRDPNVFLIFRDFRSGLEYIRRASQLYEQGLYVELDAYKCHVFMDFREVVDNEWHQYAQLEDYLGGRGVPGIEEAMRELFLRPLHHAFRELLNPGFVRWVLQAPQQKATEQMMEEFAAKYTTLLDEVRKVTQGQGEVAPIVAEAQRVLTLALELEELDTQYPQVRRLAAAVKRLKALLAKDDTLAWATLLSWLTLKPLGRIVTEKDFAAYSRSWMDEWLLGKQLVGLFLALGASEEEAWRRVNLVKALMTLPAWPEVKTSTKAQLPYTLLKTWLKEPELQALAGVNRHQNVLWFHKESMEMLLDWLLVTFVLDLAWEEQEPEALATALVSRYDVFARLSKAVEVSAYQVEKLLEAARW